MHTNTYIYNIKMRSALYSPPASVNIQEEPINLNESQEQEEKEEEEINFRRRRQQDNYNEFRNANRRNDYVPINKIGYVFSHHFPN